MERFEKLVREAKTLQADIELHVSNQLLVGRGTIKMKRPSHLLFEMKWGPSDYSFHIASEEAVAIERSQKRYREYGSIGRYFIPENDFAATPQYGMPLPLLAGSIRSLTPPDVGFRWDRTDNVGGETVDVLVATFQTEGGPSTVVAKIAGDGRLVEYSSSAGSGPGEQTIRRVLSNYKLNADLPDASFLKPVPTGFVPQTLPGDSFPINVGEKMPWEGWTAVGEAPPLPASASGKVTLVGITDVGCEPSIRAARTFATLAEQVKGKGGNAVALWLSPSAPSESIFRTVPNYVDPSGKVAALLRAPGTPMFLLVSPRGTVTRIWLGFDPSQTAAFMADVMAWADPSKG
jgi:hypothetical protein